jgi:thioredoxin 1
MNLEDLSKSIETQEAVMIYFSGQNCGVCEVLKPKIKTLFDEKFPRVTQNYIDASSNQTISSHFGVFAVPTILVFLDGKEFFRKSRNISISAFEDELSRPYNMFFGE